MFELVQIKHRNCQEQAIEARASLKLSKPPEGQDKVQINYYTFQMCKKSLTSKANVVAMLLNTNWNILCLKEYVQHLNNLKQRSQMRAAQRGQKCQQLRQKTFEEYVIDGNNEFWEEKSSN